MFTVATPAPPPLDVVALFGFLSAFSTFVSFALLNHRPGAKLSLAVSLAAQAVYGLICGAWPMSLVAIAASIIAARHWWREIKRVRICASPTLPTAIETHRSQRFGSTTNARHWAENN